MGNNPEERKEHNIGEYHDQDVKIQVKKTNIVAPEEDSGVIDDPI